MTGRPAMRSPRRPPIRREMEGAFEDPRGSDQWGHGGRVRHPRWWAPGCSLSVAACRQPSSARPLADSCPYTELEEIALPTTSKIISIGVRLLSTDTDFWFDKNHRLHSGRVRPLTPYREAIGPGQPGRILHQPFPIALGHGATPRAHPSLYADLVVPCEPRPDEGEVLTAMLDREPDTVTGRPGLLPVTDKGFASPETASHSPTPASVKHH